MNKKDKYVVPNDILNGSLSESNGLPRGGRLRETAKNPGWDKIGTQELSKRDFIGRISRTGIVSQHEKEGSARIASYLYLLILAMLAAVLPFFDAFVNNDGHKHSYEYNEIYLVTLLGLSILMVLLLFGIMFKKPKCCIPDREGGTSVELRNFNTARLSKSTMGLEVPDTAFDNHRKTAIRTKARGTSLLYRMGNIFFGFGLLAYVAIRLESRYYGFMGMKLPSSCYPILTRLIDTMVIAFVFLQMILFTVCHKVSVERHSKTARFCLMHLFITNIALLLNFILREIVANLERTEYESSLKNNTAHATDNATTTQTMKSTHPHHSNSSLPCEAYRNILDLETLINYVYPLIVHYCLSSAGAAYAIYLNVGQSHLALKLNERHISETPCVTFCQKRCQSCIPGWFLGGVVFLVTLTAIILYYVEFYTLHTNILTLPKLFSFLIVEQFIIICAIIACGVGYLYLRNMQFENVKEHQSYIIILFLVQASVYLFLILIGSNAIHHMFIVSDRRQTVFMLSIVLTSFFQTTFQTYTIVDGLSRIPTSYDQRRNKPGRSFVTFLIFMNMSLWIMHICFYALDKELSVLIFDTHYFTKTVMIYIYKIVIPLFIYYRFQSLACLGAIWTNAFKD